jgi:hypothetical protein
MGIIKQGILGGLSGKVGNVVGASWKGIDYLRSMPTHVSNPNTVGQQITRKKMILVVGFLKSCTALVRIGFSGYTMKMTAFNAATSLNLRQAITGTFPDLALDYNALQVSRGSLAPAAGAAVASTEEGVVRFSWDDNASDSNASEGDTALVVIYNPATGTAVSKTSGAERIDLLADIAVPNDFRAQEVHCYIGFADMAKLVGTQPKDCISNSVYAGAVTVA